jgi:hypothetical protein
MRLVGLTGVYNFNAHYAREKQFSVMYRFVTLYRFVTVPFCNIPFCNSVLFVMYRSVMYRSVMYRSVMYRSVTHRIVIYRFMTYHFVMSRYVPLQCKFICFEVPVCHIWYYKIKRLMPSSIHDVIMH